MHSDIAFQIRSLVSKKKKRYRENGFDLDLSYVTDRIIAMGFPADNFEALYRNYIDDVSRFFEMHHDGKYKIYNLCRERNFDASKFNGEIGRYPFDDHNPPPFTLLNSCIEDIREFLDRDPENIVAINCKAGKGRTGVIVCCSMLRSDICKDASTALTQYALCRTYNGKGITIPSQIRYIVYYDHFIKNNLTYKQTPVYLKLVKFDVIPNFNNAELQLSIYQFDSPSPLYDSKMYKISKQSRVIIFHEMLTFPIYDDLRFEFTQRSVMGTTTALCHCWLNTFFIVNQPRIFLSLSERTKSMPLENALNPIEIEADLEESTETVYRVSLTKNDIDKANKDVGCRIFPEKFQITFIFSDTAPEVNLRRWKIGNSLFFESFPGCDTKTTARHLETKWKSTSSQFYNTGD